MKRKLKGKVAIVTGAGQGMGRAVAQMFAAEGARVLAADIRTGPAKTTVRRIRDAGGSAVAETVDVTKAGDVSRMVQRCLKEFGTVDILVNNAGILRPTRITEISEEEWDLVVDVNLKGTFLCTKAVLPIMQKKKYGRIVNMSSSAGKSVSTLGGAHYTAAKAAVLGLTRATAKEMAAFGITCNSVCPGLIDTEMVRTNCSAERLSAYERSFPVSRLGTPDEVAMLILFLASDDAAYITGASIDINGGDLMV